eukprot:COSAG02_NODE_26601_length_629_cov_1.222642_1_plen_20_part_10
MTHVRRKDDLRQGPNNHTGL